MVPSIFTTLAVTYAMRSCDESFDKTNIVELYAIGDSMLTNNENNVESAKAAGGRRLKLRNGLAID